MNILEIEKKRLEQKSKTQDVTDDDIARYTNIVNQTSDQTSNLLPPQPHLYNVVHAKEYSGGRIPRKTRRKRRIRTTRKINKRPIPKKKIPRKTKRQYRKK
jgi:hypothetical protein